MKNDDVLGGSWVQLVYDEFPEVIDELVELGCTIDEDETNEIWTEDENYTLVTLRVDINKYELVGDFSDHLVFRPVDGCGKLVIWEKGSKESEGELQEWKNDGKWTYYYPNGKKESEGVEKPSEGNKPFPDNLSKRHGKWTEWYENGNKKSEGSYLGLDKSGKPIQVGKWSWWYENGQVECIGHYKKKDDPGFSIRHGRWTKWFENGLKKFEGTYKDYQEHGKWTHWNENGTKEFDWSYKNGEFNGKNISWFEKGTHIEENYLEGQKHGESISYYINGQILLRENYKMGVLNGDWESFFENGQKWGCGNFINGVREGTWNLWSKNGELILKVNYNNGKPNQSLIEPSVFGDGFSKGQNLESCHDSFWGRDTTELIDLDIQIQF
jgi:antitoxin component YwqK of YwqJK toxin-antitoxin module